MGLGPNIAIQRAEIQITCNFDNEILGIKNATIVQLADELNITRWEFSRNHWAVKEVDLFRALLRRDLRRRVSPRVFQITDHEEVETDLISVMMPFDARLNPVYETLQSLCESLELRCIRADKIWENHVVMQDVVSLIDRSRIVIADCTYVNPNVFYEIGIAHTLGRDVIMITQQEGNIPFDLRHFRFVQYLNNHEGRATLTDVLRARINTLILRNNF